MARRRRLGPSLSFFAFQDIITAVVGIFILITIILILELVQRVEAASVESKQAAQPVVDALEAIESEVARLRDDLESRTNEQAEFTEVNAFNRDEKLEELRSRVVAAQRRIEMANDRIRAGQSEHEKAKADDKQLKMETAKLESVREELEELEDRESKLRQQIEYLSEDASQIFRDQLDDGRSLTLVTLTGREVRVKDALTRSSQTMRGARRLDDFRAWLTTHASTQRHFFLRIQPGGAADYQSLKEALVESGASYGFTVVDSNESVRLGFELERQP